MLVLCAGMLRSGSTFQYNLVSSLVEDNAVAVRHGQVDLKADWLSNPDLAGWARDEKVFHVIKDHIEDCPHLGSRELEMVRAGRIKICYIHRDIRDVAASAKEVWRLDTTTLWDRLDRAVTTYDLLRDTPGVLRQRYEEVTVDVGRAVREIARFLGLEPTAASVESIVQRCSLEAMDVFSRSKRFVLYHTLRNAVVRAVPAAQRFGWPALLVPLRFDRRTLVGGQHISSTRGSAGAWRAKLTPEEQDLITARYRAYLLRAGYSLSAVNPVAPSA